MAFDAFAKIGDIKGESLDDKHKDWIEVLSFSAGITRRSQGGRPNIEDFKIVKKMDAASPLIFDAACEGDSVGNATFVARKAGKGQQEFLVIKMSDVIITSVQTSGSAGDDRPADQVNMAFAKVEYSFFPQTREGALDAPISAGWDLKANKKV